jgi:hypothetical protein
MRNNAVSRREFLGSTGKAIAAVSCCMFCGNAMAAESGIGSKFKTSYYSACGNYCGACPSLMKGEKMDKPEKAECLGCFSDRIHPSEANCELRKCAMKKNVKVCSLCNDYPCDKTRKFFTKQTIWTTEMKKNLVLIKEKGLEKWLADEKARWNCAKCGLRISFCDKKCPKCGTALKNLG